MDDWVEVIALEELPEGRPVRAELDGATLLLVRSGDGVSP